MLFANHNSTDFFATTDHIGQSLINDVWTFINRWQEACDHGYGIVSGWDEYRDSILKGFDWFCINVLRNLIAIAVFTTLVIWYGATKFYAWYVASGRIWVHLRLVVSLVGGCAALCLRILTWLEETGTPIAIKWCDRWVQKAGAIVCPWLFV